MPRIWVAQVNDRLSMMRISKTKIKPKWESEWEECCSIVVGEKLYEALRKKQAYLIHDESGEKPAKNAKLIPDESKCNWLVPDLSGYKGYSNSIYRYIEESNVGFKTFETGGSDEEADYPDPAQAVVLPKRKEWFKQLYDKLSPLDKRYRLIDNNPEDNSFIRFIDGDELRGRIDYYDMASERWEPRLNGAPIDEYRVDDEFVADIHSKITQWQLAS